MRVIGPALASGLLVFSSTLSPALGAYCSGPAVELLIAAKQGGMSLDPRPLLQKIRTECKPGDTISIPGSFSAVIAEACDFNKSVFRQPDGAALCVIKPR